MTKKRARTSFIILGIFTVIGFILSFCSFNIPFSHYRFNGFANSISLGLDLSGGISAVYQTEVGASEDAINSTTARLESILFDNGFSEAQVTRQGSDKIRVEVPELSDSEELFDLIGKPASLFISTDKEFDILNPTGEYTSGKDIKEVYVSYDNQNDEYVVALEFNGDGTADFAAVTGAAADGDKTIYIFIGEEEPLQVTCENKLTQGSTVISGGSIADYESAKEYALRIMSGTFSAELSLLEASVVSATLGANALTLGLVAGAIALLLIMVIMGVRYRVFGLVANLSLVIYLILMLFFLQAIPFVQLTLPGIAGIILSLGMAVDGNIIIFERIREEYKTGKKLPLSVKGGFQKAFWPIFDSNITTIITSIVLFILGSASIKGFAITLLLGILLSMFSTLVVTRILTKWSLPFVASKPEYINMVRVKKAKENNDVIVEEGAKTEQEIIVEAGK